MKYLVDKRSSNIYTKSLQKVKKKIKKRTNLVLKLIFLIFSFLFNICFPGFLANKTLICFLEARCLSRQLVWDNHKNHEPLLPIRLSSGQWMFWPEWRCDAWFHGNHLGTVRPHTCTKWREVQIYRHCAKAGSHLLCKKNKHLLKLVEKMWPTFLIVLPTLKATDS